jgi:hypothetical protein
MFTSFASFAQTQEGPKKSEVKAPVCDQSKLVKVMRSSAKSAKGEKVTHYEVLTLSPGSQPKKIETFKLSKFYAKSCLSLFKANDFLWSDQILFDHISGDSHFIHPGGGFFISEEDMSYSVWNCYVASNTAKLSGCVEQAELKIFDLNKSGKRAVVEDFSMKVFIDSLNAQEIVKKFTKAYRLLLTADKDAYTYSAKLESSSSFEQGCAAGATCPVESVDLGKFKIKLMTPELPEIEILK